MSSAGDFSRVARRTFSRPLYLLPGLLGGLAIAAVFIVSMRGLHWPKSDFGQFYLAGKAWRQRALPYGPLPASFAAPGGPDPGQMRLYYYPPMVGMLSAPLSLLPFATAQALRKLALLCLFFMGVGSYSRRIFPDWPLSLHLFGVGLAALSSGFRRAMAQLQPSALIVALRVLRRQPANAAAWVMLVAGALFCYLMTARLMQGWLSGIVVPYGLLALAPIYGYFVLLVFLGAAFALRRYAGAFAGRAVRHERRPVPARTG